VAARRLGAGSQMRHFASAHAMFANAFWLGTLFALIGLGWVAPAHAQNTVCAQAQIQIQQKVSLERQAFDAVMRINNGLQTGAIQNVGINLTFQDQAGNGVVATSDPNNTSASFFVSVSSLSGINAIDGTGTVAPTTTGEIHWLIVPAAGSGGTQPQGRLYFVGASLSYTLLGNTTTVAVTPDSITVTPQPLLALDYFLPGNVYADDPLTPQVEPPVPFTLGVRIKNVGGGTAAQTVIESAQPTIVDNQQGLPIGFQILNGYVNDQPAGDTLLLNFGDIGPGASVVGRWIMETTLSGKFTALQAGFTHADSLGGALTSLIQGVTTHLLIHDVLVDLPGRDSVRDFLALDGNVVNVYESQGTDTAVTNQSANARLQATSGNQYNLSFQATTGFAYVTLTDPFGGQALPGPVVRSDGKTLPTQNAWLSKTRNADLSWSYFVNFFDVNTTGIYSVAFAGSGAGASLSGFVYADANNNGLKDPGEVGIGVTPVTLTGTDDQGANVNTTAYANQDGSFSFVQLRPGTYTLAVGVAAGYGDGKLAVGSAGGVAAGNTISGIVLSTNTNGTGYLFAKVISGAPQADLGVTMTASATQVPVGGNVTFTITASNMGPSTATAAKVTDVLPAALTFVGATASGGGTYNNASGIWTVGDLTNGANATLMLMAKVTSTAAPIINTATIASMVADPNATNNQASVTLDPNAGSLKVTQSVVQEARILALVSCTTTSGQDDPTCAAARASFLTGYLSALGLNTDVITDTNSFRTAFRSGRYNTYWVSGGAAKLTGTLAEEIREAAFRGDSLIVDGPHSANSTVLDDVTGITVGAGTLGSNQPILLTGGTNNIATLGDALPLTLSGGQPQATFASLGGAPAIVANTYGQGHGVVMGFDLVGTLQQPASEQLMHSYITQLLGNLAPQPPDPVVGAAYVRLITQIQNLSSDTTVDVSATLPSGVSVVDTVPTPTSGTASLVDWQFALPAGQTTLLDLGLRMPTISGPYNVQTTLNKIVGGMSSVYGGYNFPVNVVASDQFGPQLLSNLQGLSLTNSADAQARNNAVSALQTAQTELAATNNVEAIAQFLAAADVLDQVTSVDVRSYLIATDKWLQEAELRWNPTCPDNVSQLASVVGGGFVRNRQTGHFVQQVTITANQAITGPVSLQLINLSSNATLFAPSGTASACNPPAGSPLMTVSTSDLAAGATATISLEFVNPTQQTITYTTQVLSGGGH
jgi:uncharacterized repeat protein (TIGR01451 family)